MISGMAVPKSVIADIAVEVLKPWVTFLHTKLGDT